MVRGLLEHGYEGVRQIEAHVTNTMGWSATTGEVAPWVYQQLTETFVLDPAMRERLAALNPTASAKVANRLIEAHERHYWTPDEAMLDALRRAGEELEDRLEGVGRELRHEHLHHPTMAIRKRVEPRRADGEGSVQVQLDPDAEDRHRQGVRGLRQGRHRQEHDLVEPLGRLLQARQARAADRLRSRSTTRPSR